MDIKKADTLYNPSFISPVDPDKNFIMGASLKSISGNSSFGLSFADEAGNLNAFLIYNSKSGYEIYHRNGQTSGIISGPAFTPLIKKDAYNILLVEKIGNTVYFFVNYKFVASVPFSNIKARKYGLFIPGGQQIACDYFYLRQKRGPINLVENYESFGAPEKFEPGTNSGYAQTNPIISADGEILFYSSVDMHEDESVFRTQFCRRSKNGNWEKAKSLYFPKSEKDISVVALSADKNEVILSSGITFSSSYQMANGWSAPKELPFNRPYNISALGTGLSASGDFKTLIIALDQKDTYGETDLYVSFFRDSAWTAPLNLGKNINLFGDELSPFLAPDNKTLYFSSNSWPGYGGYDIFMSKRLDDSWTNWSEPKNLGPLINTDRGDIYYSTSAAGEEGYLARSTEKDRYFHIYRIKQPKSAAPEPMVLIQGKVLDSQTGQPLNAVITYSIIGKSKSSGSVHSNKHSGTFAISLPKGKNYVLSVRKKGFASEQRNISTLNLNRYEAEEVELKLTSLKKGTTVTMHNLFFASNRAVLLPGSEAELSRLYSILIENPSLKIEVRGHTQLNNSSAKLNHDLSLARAVAVKDYLVKKGLNPNRIITNGYGNSQPIETAKKDTISQAVNRRVEFKILEN